VGRCQENWAGRILCGGSFEQQLQQTLESSFHQETCMPKKLKVKISDHDRNVYYINSKDDQLMNLNDLVEFNIQDLIELRLTNTIPILTKNTTIRTIRKESQYSK